VPVSAAAAVVIGAVRASVVAGWVYLWFYLLFLFAFLSFCQYYSSGS
jgi:hypothetical protein